MSNYAKATVEGFVTQDPVLSETKTGKQVCNFSLAVNHYTSPNTEPRVSFIDIETWQRIADFCSRSVKKGRRILVMGSLRQDKWEGKDGKMQSRIKLIGNEIRFLEAAGSTLESEGEKEQVE